MQAIILAGGLGTRLRALVNDRPKAMASFANKPFLEYQIQFLKRHRIHNIILCLGYLKENIQQYFQDGSPWGISISYALEDDFLGTAGALKNAEDLIYSRFFVLNGDSFFNIDLKNLANFHEHRKSENEQFFGTIALAEVPDREQFGSVILDSDHNIVAFEEKSNTHNLPGLINAGIYLLEPAVLERIPSSKTVSIEKETFPSLLQMGKCLAGYPSDGFFVDIGTPDGFFRFKEFIGEETL
jgi:NDP-sugar pyrophosphorylase family protein